MLRYESAAKVGVSAVQSIIEEIGAIRRTWWRGALGLDPSEEGRPALLSGKTVLFHAHGIPDEDDVFMAFADAAFIVGRLSDWAKRYKIKYRSFHWGIEHCPSFYLLSRQQNLVHWWCM